MAAKKLQILSQKVELEVNANVRYEKMDREEKPAVKAVSPEGKDVSERTIYNGKPILPGETQRLYVDEDGNMFPRSEVKFMYEGEEVSEIEQTKVFEVVDFQPVKAYTDEYVIGKYYELYADDNSMKKDYDRKRAIAGNQVQMRKLWEYLNTNNLVARGEFNASSRGFMGSDGYIRAITMDQNKWGLEIGVFKEAKVFKHLQEGIPAIPKETAAAPAKKKLKRI